MAGSIQEFAIKAEAIDLPTAQIGYWRVVWRRFKRHRVAYVGFFFFVLLLVLGHRRALSGALRARSSLLVGAHADAVRKALAGDG